jgi:hypothetical protein
MDKHVKPNVKIPHILQFKGNRSHIGGVYKSIGILPVYELYDLQIAILFIKLCTSLMKCLLSFMITACLIVSFITLILDIDVTSMVMLLRLHMISTWSDTQDPIYETCIQII